MTSEKLLEVMEKIDDRYVEEAVPAKKKTGKKWIAVLAVAACLVLAIALPMTSAWGGAEGAAPYSAFVVWSGAYACMEESTYIDNGLTILRLDNDTRRIQAIEKSWMGWHSIYAGSDGLYGLVQPDEGGQLGLYRLGNYGSYTLVNDLSSLPSQQVSNYQVCGDNFAVEVNKDIYLGRPDGDLTRIFDHSSFNAGLSLWKTTPNWVFVIGYSGHGPVDVMGYYIPEARAVKLYTTTGDNLAWIAECNGSVYWNNLRDGFYRKQNADSEPVLLKSSEEMPIGAGIYDDRFMYLYSDKSENAEEHGLYLYDLDCQQLDFLPAPEEGMLSYAFSTDQDVYFYRFSAAHSVPVYYIEKSLIGSGNLSWNAVDTAYQREKPFN